MSYKIIAFLSFVLACELITHVVYASESGCSTQVPILSTDAFVVVHNDLVTEVPTYIAFCVHHHTGSSIMLEYEGCFVEYALVPEASRTDGVYYCFCGALFRPVNADMLTYFPDDDSVAMTLPTERGQIYVFNVDGVLMLVAKSCCGGYGYNDSTSDDAVCEYEDSTST